MNEKNNLEKEAVKISLPAGAVAFMETISRQAGIPSGMPVPAAEVVEALVEVLMQSAQSVEDSKPAEALIQRLQALLRIKGEKRRFLRLKKTFIAGFRKIESLDAFGQGLTEDIGLGGFRIEMPYLVTPLACGQMVEIGLKDSADEGPAVKGIGRVVWLKKKEGAQGFEAGIMLTHIREPDRERFQQYFNEGDQQPSV